MRLRAIARLLAAILPGAVSAPAGATVEAQLYADTYVVEDAGRFYSVLDVYAKGSHLGDTIGASILGLSTHAVVFKTSQATGTSDIFVQGGSAGNGWLPTDSSAKSWDSFVASGNRSQGTNAKVTNRAGSLIDHGVAGSWAGASNFTQMGVAGSNYIDEGTASGWYSSKGGNAYSSAGASENPFARVSLYNSNWNAAYADLYRGADVMLTKGQMQNGRTSAAGSAVLSGAAGASLDWYWMVGRFTIDVTDRAGQAITLQVQFNMVGKNGGGTNNETGTTFSGTMATGTNPAYKVSRHFSFAQVPTPTIVSISPTSGPETGGTTITIAGTNLMDGTVTVGGGDATVTASSPTSITALTPGGTPGPQDVIVSTVWGQATSPVPFEYVASPSISSVTPAAGPVAGGTPITVNGTNLSGATSVRVGGVAATSVLVAGDGLSLTAVVPAGPAGAGDVTVTTAGGEASLAGGFTFVAAPTLTTVSPAAGPIAGNASVMIKGTNFTSVGGAPTVTVGGLPATDVVVADSTTINASTPGGTLGAKSVAVTTVGGTATKSNAYTYLAAPTVTGVTPSMGSAAGNTLITITGTNFTSVGGAPTVTVGGMACTNVVASGATSISAKTPSGAVGAQDVVVTTSGGSATVSNGYTYVSAPTVDSVTPVAGRLVAGTAVTITGTNLTGATSVKFGAALATGVVVAGDGLSLTALAPAGSVGAKDVVVTTVGGTGTLSGGYTYVGVPAVTAVSPASGSTVGETPITLTGTNFTSLVTPATVTVGGAACTEVVVVSATTITAKAPAGAAGPKSVGVTTVGGTATRANAYTYVVSPAISVMGPAFGPVTGGTTLTISGSGLSGATVRVGGVLCTSVSATATGITARTPAGTAGPKDVVVTTAGGVATQAGGFTYAAVPTVSGVTPVAGPLSAGTPITVTGTGFTDLGGVVAVKVGTASCTDVVVVNATTITAVAPAGAAGVKAVVVTTAGGTATKASGYTHVAAPTVTGSTPVAGPVAGNTLVTITGTNFTTVGGAPTVTVGGVACTNVTVSSATSLTARTPAGTSGSKDVVVTTVGGTGTKVGGYTYAGVPTVTGVTPSSGPLAAGTSITVTGTNFTSAGVAATVKVGGVSCTSVVVVNATTITAKVPAGTAGSKDVVVTTVGGTGTGAGAYTYVGTPTIATVSPSSGPTSGGTVITITGTNLSTVTSVKVGGVSCTGVVVVVVVNATTIQATTPSSTVGVKAVVVTTAGGTATRAGGFTYTASLTGGMGAPKGRGSGAVGGGTASEAGVVDAMPEWESLVRSLPVESGRCVRWILEGAKDAPACEAVDCADAASWAPDESESDEMDWDGNGVSDLCQLRCGDLDLDGLIDFSDLAVLTGMYGLKPALGVGDLDGDGEIGNPDAALLLDRIGAEASGSQTAAGR